MQLPVGDNGNKGEQILQLMMQPPPPLDLGNKSQASNARARYTSDVAETEEFVVKEKFIAFPQDHEALNKDELEEKSIVSITTHGIIVLTIIGVSGMLSKQGQQGSHNEFPWRKESHCEVI